MFRNDGALINFLSLCNILAIKLVPFFGLSQKFAEAILYVYFIKCKKLEIRAKCVDKDIS